MDWKKWIPGRKKTAKDNLSVIPEDAESVSEDLDALNFPAPPDVVAVLDREKTEREVKLLDAHIKNLEIENLTHKLEVEAKIANDIRLAELRQRRLDLKAEAMRREQDRLDATAKVRADLTQFKLEQEQLLKLNDQAFAQAKEKQEQKQRARAERAAAKAKQRIVNREVWQVRREKIWNFLKDNTRLFSSVVFSKKFGILLVVAGLLTLATWLYQEGYFSVWFNQVLTWLSQAWAWTLGLWDYRWYIFVGVSIGLILWLLKFQKVRETVITKSTQVAEEIKTLLGKLKIATSILVIIGLMVIAIFGISLHSVFITVSAISLIPLFVGWKSKYSLYTRLTFVVFTISLVVMLSQVKLH